MELTLIDYDMVHYHPSKVAAAASCLSQKVLGQGKWVSVGFQKKLVRFCCRPSWIEKASAFSQQEIVEVQRPKGKLLGPIPMEIRMTPWYTNVF